MKKLFLLIGLALSFQLMAQISESDNEALDKLIADKVEIEADTLKSTALSLLFDAEFFRVKRTPLYTEDGGFSIIILIKINNKMMEIEDVQALLPAIKKSFKLIGEEEARKLRDALNLVLPDYGSPREYEIVRKENQWMLVTEEWFGDKKGYVVDIDEAGTITKIEYSSELVLE